MTRRLLSAPSALSVAVLSALSALSVSSVSAQAVALRGATIHTLSGPEIPNGTVVIDSGRITAVGAAVSLPSGARVIDVSGLHVYPGFFDAVTQLGLTEIGAVDVTNDHTELGEFNPHLLASTAVHPPSEHIPVARANGITHAAAAPQARAAGVGGQASVINLDGWTVEEMLVAPSVGFVFTWPTVSLGGGRFGGGRQASKSYEDAKKEYDEQVRRLTGWLEDARRYDLAAGARQARRDLKLEAFSRVTRKDLPLLIHVNEERYIRDVLDFADGQDVRIVILGGRQAYKLRERLAEKNIPVIFGATQALPSGPDERYDEQYAAPGLLHQAGVKFAFATFGSSDSRTLPWEAANAVSYGLPREEALRAITLRGAEIYGLADRLGTIAAGKIANLIVTDGDPLEYRTQVRHLFIAGHEVGLENRHRELYERYRARPRR